MRLRKVLLSMIAIFAVHCNSGGPGYESKNGDPTGGVPPIQKPAVCKVAFDQTCWKSTVEKITSCMKPDQGLDQFSSSRQVCGNDSGKLILFPNAATLFTNPFDAIHSRIQFKVIPDQAEQMNECFEVKGTLSNLEFKILATGETARIAMDGEKMSFTCVDGQQVIIPRENINDCQQVHGKASDVIPGVEAGPFYEGNLEKGWFFKIKGAGLKQDIFRCYN